MDSKLSIRKSKKNRISKPERKTRTQKRSVRTGIQDLKLIRKNNPNYPECLLNEYVNLKNEEHN